jgi:murein DD-endopeptidase MepM/ murein hydrolase activator NlpD
VRPKISQKPFAKPRAAPPSIPAQHLTIRRVYLYGGFALLLATNVLTLVGFLMAPDIGKLFSGQNDTVYSAYEDRIAQLRLEVDRLQSRHYAQAGDINLQLQELAQAQEVLVEQHQFVKQLVDKAAALGVAPAASDPAPAVTDAAASDDAPAGPATAPQSADGDGDAGAKVAAAAESVNKMIDDSRQALASLSEEATSKTDQIIGALATVGIKPKLPTSDDGTGEGGPLLAPVDGAGDSSSLIDGANEVAAALERFAAAKGAADIAPVHRPVLKLTRISSTFGNRKDPFTGRLAFHSGIDFAAAYGTTVISAGAGKVSFVGQISGYGNVVEVTHANGLISRYGHLSAFLVKEGDAVKTGTPIARVGSTGRSTGPHLHFEIRRADNAVDPARYLNAGKALARIVAG